MTEKEIENCGVDFTLILAWIGLAASFGLLFILAATGELRIG